MASAEEPVYKPEQILEPIRDAIQEILSSAAHSESADDAYSALVRALTNGRKHRPKVVSAAWAAETDALAIRFRDAQVNRDQQSLQHAKVELRRLQEQLRHINLYGEPDDTSADPMLKRLGELKLEEMLTEKTGIVEVSHPDQVELENWLVEDLVKGKFVKWWPHKIASAKYWHVEVSPIWDALASLLDRLFHGTCNTFNEYEARPHVTEAQLYPYLKSVHGLSADKVDKLPLVRLLQLLHGDVEKSASCAGPNARHSDDFRSVHWFGADYIFTANQAACVAELWRNWENKTPVVGGQALLEAANSDQGRFDLVFRGHDAWGTMIVSPNKGAYCLRPPSENPSPKSKPQKKTARAGK